MLCWNKGKFMEAEIPIALKVRASSLQHCTLCHYMHINSYIGGANAKISEFLHFFLSEKCKNFFYYMHNAIIASTYAQSQFPSLWWWWWRCGAMQCEKKKVDKHIVHMHTHIHWIIWRRKSLKVTRHHHPMNKKTSRMRNFFLWCAHIAVVSNFMWQLLSFFLYVSEGIWAIRARVDAAIVNVMGAEIKEKLKSGFVAVFMTFIRYTPKLWDIHRAYCWEME